MQGLLPAWVEEEWGLRGLAVLTSLSSTGKNLYTNEYVAIKLVSPGLHTQQKLSPCGVWGRRKGSATPQVTLHLLPIPPGAHQVAGTAAAPRIPLLQAAQLHRYRHAGGSAGRVGDSGGLLQAP